MIELLKLLVESLLKGFSLDKLAVSRQDKRLAKIGTEVFLLYTSINEILVVGEMITSELERATSWLAEKARAGEIDRCYSTHLDFLLPQQGNNILRFQRSLKRLALELQIVAPEVYSQIQPLMHGKGNALGRLVDFLLGNYGQDVALPTVDMPQLKSTLAELHRDTNKKRLFDFEREKKLSRYVTSVKVPNLGYIGQDAAPVIRSYLEKENPRERLEKIEELLHKLRDGIEKNFSLQDILLEVGDRRVANSDPWV